MNLTQFKLHAISFNIFIWTKFKYPQNQFIFPINWSSLSSAQQQDGAQVVKCNWRAPYVVQLFIHPLKVSFSKKKKYTHYSSIKGGHFKKIYWLLLWTFWLSKCLPSPSFLRKFFMIPRKATHLPTGHHRKNKIK